jgi:hypothetical protein
MVKSISKGERFMTLMTQMDCCSLLGIDPKTLRHWCSSAQIQFLPHPTDGRIKCLTGEQVQQLAALHGRPLSPAAASSSERCTATTPPSSDEKQTSPSKEESELSLVQATTSGPDQAELRKVVSGLEAKVMTLQEQLAQLALELLRERDSRYEQRLSTLEALLAHSAGMSGGPPKPATVTADLEEPRTSANILHLQPAKPRARPRGIPRVEYSAAGSYVLVCPWDGVLPFSADSQQWFTWLASLASFRFVCPQGRFTAYRESLTCSWKAYRTFHGHSYKCPLGQTPGLTIAHLEQAAATLQSKIA